MVHMMYVTGTRSALEEGTVCATLRVLIADDNDLVRAALQELVESDPRFTVVSLADGVDTAVAAAGELQPDVALVDVRMPGGGPAAARGIRAAAPNAVVVACSAYDDRYSRDEMAAAGAAIYLVKGRDDVVAGLRRACSLD